MNRVYCGWRPFASILGGLVVVGACLPAVAVLAQIAEGEKSLAAPVEMTAQQDHQRLMELLGMKSMRPGANGSNPQAANYANYDEAKANLYPSLPDPLLTNDRRQVNTAELWSDVRRPEIVELFDREIFGRVPANVPAVKWEVAETAEGMNGDVAIVTKRLVGHVDNSAYPAVTVEIGMTLNTPKDAKGPVPVIMQFSGGGFGGGGPRRGAAPGAARGGGGGGAREGAAAGQPAVRRGGGFGGGPSWQSQVLANGWGYATINTGSVQADNGGGLTRGIIGLVNQGQPRKLEDWGVLRAWAWGASRALDYFETDPAVDAKKIGLEGHSRWGKATLVAMAYDPRFAIAYVSSSGAGGAKIWRRNWGELVENVAGTGEYHWMAGNFLKYAGPLTWDDLPVDMHELVAMCAPRPVFISGGATTGDGWVDAKGMFLAAAGAQGVYELLGKKGLGTNEFPPIETGLMEGDIAFRQHAGGHTDGPNWPTFLDFAGRYLH